jgi:hypothetical protein
MSGAHGHHPAEEKEEKEKKDDGTEAAARQRRRPRPRPRRRHQDKAAAARREQRREEVMSRCRLDEVHTHIEKLEGGAYRPQYDYLTVIHYADAAHPADRWQAIAHYADHMAQLKNSVVVESRTIDMHGLCHEMFSNDTLLTVVAQLMAKIKELGRDVYVRREEVMFDEPHPHNVILWLRDNLLGPPRRRLVQYLIMVTPIVRELKRRAFLLLLDVLNMDRSTSGRSGGGDGDDDDAGMIRRLKHALGLQVAMTAYVKGRRRRRKKLGETVRRIQAQLDDHLTSSSSDYDEEASRIGEEAAAAAGSDSDASDSDSDSAEDNADEDEDDSSLSSLSKHLRTAPAAAATARIVVVQESSSAIGEPEQAPTPTLAAPSIAPAQPVPAPAPQAPAPAPRPTLTPLTLVRLSGR